MLYLEVPQAWRGTAREALRGLGAKVAWADYTDGSTLWAFVFSGVNVDKVKGALRAEGLQWFNLRAA